MPELMVHPKLFPISFPTIVNGKASLPVAQAEILSVVIDSLCLSHPLFNL